MNSEGDFAVTWGGDGEFSEDIKAQRYSFVQPCTPQNWFLDFDGDGYGSELVTSSCIAPMNTVATNTDCNDNSNAIHPGAVEICNPYGHVGDNLADHGAFPAYCWSV